MGLDMYLSGKRFFTFDRTDTDDEGYTISEIVVKLGYWRKHANLHGWLVETFGPKDDQGNAVDNCEEIELSLDDLKKCLEVVKDPSKMPKTTGFFFGESDNDAEQIKDDTEMFSKAIAFLTSPAVTGNDKGVWRSVSYRASW